MGVHIHADVVHPGPNRRHPCRPAAHERVNDGIARLGHDLQQVGQQGDGLDAIVIVAPHYLTLVKSTRLARLFQHGAHWKRIRAQIPFPIRRLAILKNGITAHPLSEGITSPQSAGSPFLDILRDGRAIQFLAHNHDGFVTGPEPRIKFISEASRNGSTVPIVPDPDVSDFKPYIFKVHGEPMRHIGEAEHGNMRTGFQHPIGFFPDPQGG